MQRSTKSRGPASRATIAATLLGALVPFFAASLQAAPALAAAPGTAITEGGPRAPGARFRQAQALARTGQHAAAVDLYAGLSAEYPDNVDYLFGEAQARFWNGDHDRARRLVARARRLAPDYEDLWILEHRILKENAAADGRELHEFRRAARSRFPGAAWLGDEPEAAALPWNWESGIDREFLDNGADDWQRLYVQVDRQWPDDRSMSLAVARHGRFGRTDHEGAIGGGFGFADVWRLEGLLRLSPGADFLPERVAELALGRVLGDGWIAGAGVGRRSYADQSVDNLELRIERYFGPFRAAGYVRQTRHQSVSTYTYRGVVNYFAPSGSRYGLTVAAGEEVEVIAPGQLLDMDISAVALHGRHPVGKGLSILWRVGTHRQGSVYRRNNLGLSIAGEF